MGRERTMKKVRMTPGYYWAQNKATMEYAVVECRDDDFYVPGGAGCCIQSDFFYEWFLGPGPLVRPENPRAFREMWRPES